MIVLNNVADEPWSLAADGGETAELSGTDTGSDAGAGSDVGDAVVREQRVLVWDNGDRYEGEWLGELMDGAGTWTGADGERYVGEWRDGERHGRGLSTGPDGSMYDGQWEDGVEHGRGLYSDPGALLLSEFCDFSTPIFVSFSMPTCVTQRRAGLTRCGKMARRCRF